MEAQEEKFVPIPITEYLSVYEISNIGNVKSTKRGIIMRPCMRNGYLSVCLSHQNIKKNHLIHRLVAIAFIPNPDDLQVVNHKDGNRLNNSVFNLEWTTYSGNAVHSCNILMNQRGTVAVKQISLDGTVLNTFDSIKEAANYTGVSAKKIPSVCNGSRNQTGGYKWEHVEDKIHDIPHGKSLSEYPNYIITNNGQVYSIKTNRYLVLNKHNSGYLTVGLSNGTKKDFYVHVLVATIYIPKPLEKNYVNHKDRNKSNNNIENLEWVTSTENNLHAVETGINTYKKSVIKCDVNGTEIKRYDKIKDASLDCGVDASSIVRVCKGKQQSAGGYLWKYY